MGYQSPDTSASTFFLSRNLLPPVYALSSSSPFFFFLPVLGIGHLNSFLLTCFVSVYLSHRCWNDLSDCNKVHIPLLFRKPLCDPTDYKVNQDVRSHEEVPRRGPPRVGLQFPSLPTPPSRFSSGTKISPWLLTPVVAFLLNPL